MGEEESSGLWRKGPTAEKKLTAPEDPRGHFDQPDDTSLFCLVPRLSNLRGGQVKVAGAGWGAGI